MAKATVTVRQFPDHFKLFCFPRPSVPAHRWPKDGLASGTQRVILPQQGVDMVKFLLWCILFVLCWPAAVVGLILYPVVWLLLIPFRLIGITVAAVLSLFKAIILLPARLLGQRPGR